MTLHETASALQEGLEAAREADTDDAMLSRGRRIRDNVASIAEHLEAVQVYRVTIGRADTPPLSSDEIHQAVERFETARSSSGPRAFQQPSADTLLDVLTALTKRVDQWVKSTWRESLAEAQDLLNGARSVGSHGSAIARRKVRNRASRIEAVLDLNPVRDREALQAHLNAEGLEACLTQLNQLIEELRAAIASIDSEQAAMPEEVKAAIERAASEEGLPLGEVTLKLIAALQSAGVLDDFVVRHCD